MFGLQFSGEMKQPWSERGAYEPKIAAAVRGAHFQARVLVEQAFEDEVLQRDRGVERIADHVGEPAVALEAARELRRALRVNEQRDAEFLRFRPHRMKLRLGEIHAEDAAANGRAL